MRLYDAQQSHLRMGDGLTAMEHLADESHYARGIDNPSSMPTGVWLLLQELGACMFATKEHAAAIDTHHVVPAIFGHFVYHPIVLGASDASVVDHA